MARQGRGADEAKRMPGRPGTSRRGFGNGSVWRSRRGHSASSLGQSCADMRAAAASDLLSGQMCVGQSGRPSALAQTIAFSRPEGPMASMASAPTAPAICRPTEVVAAHQAAGSDPARFARGRAARRWSAAAAGITPPFYNTRAFSDDVPSSSRKVAVTPGCAGRGSRRRRSPAPGRSACLPRPRRTPSEG